MLEHRKAGRVRYCRLVPGALDEAEQWLAYYRRFWTQRLAGLHKHLEAE